MAVRGERASPTAHRPPVSRELVLRAISGLVLGAVVIAALLVGGWPFALLWLVAGIVGAAEWLAMSRCAPGRPLLGVTALALASLTAALHLAGPTWIIPALLAGGVAVLAILAGEPASRRRAVLGFLGGAVIALVPPALRDDPGIGLVGPAWMFAVVWSTDILAYFVGRAIGGPKVMPRVSPKKTWSGAVGGLVAGTVAGLAVVLAAQGRGWDVLDRLPLVAVALAGAAASILSQAGDFAESGLKRRWGVKDSGHSIPGHGGVMDRLDGFFAVALLAGLTLVGRHLLAV